MIERMNKCDKEYKLLLYRWSINNYIQGINDENQLIILATLAEIFFNNPTSAKKHGKIRTFPICGNRIGNTSK